MQTDQDEQTGASKTFLGTDRLVGATPQRLVLLPLFLNCGFKLELMFELRAKDE